MQIHYPARTKRHKQEQKDAIEHRVYLYYFQPKGYTIKNTQGLLHLN